MPVVPGTCVKHAQPAGYSDHFPAFGADYNHDHDHAASINKHADNNHATIVNTYLNHQPLFASYIDYDHDHTASIGKHANYDHGRANDQSDPVCRF